MRARRRGLKAALLGRTLLIYRLIAEDADGRLVDSQLVSLLISKQLECWSPSIIPSSVIDTWHRNVTSTSAAFSAARLARERAIAARLSSQPLSPFQPALFDQRAERAAGMVRQEHTDAAGVAAARLAAVERQARIDAPSARLLLVVRP